ncbi:hypothetical protein C8T65DRAFT_700005 [Cerioporus squamosus]|nr:hypothetical protein C8T65DRAFT_700005 [Cerioporus squamosus]
MAQSTQTRSTALQSLYDRSARVQSAWIARPAEDHPARSVWVGKFWSDLAALVGSIRKVEERDVRVPPFVVAFLVEHNAAFAAHRPYSLPALDPALAPRAMGNFQVDDDYTFEPVRGGWWNDPLLAKDTSPTPDSTSHPAPTLVPSIETSAGRTTRSTSKAAGHVAEVSSLSPSAAESEPEVSAPAVSVPARRKETGTPRERKDSAGQGPGGAAPRTRARAAGAKRSSSTPRPTSKATKAVPSLASGSGVAKGSRKAAKTAKSSPPPVRDPGPFPQSFDFSGQDLVDHWVPMCNHCTNIKGHCSLVALHGNGTVWTKEQRVYILYDFQRRADPTAPHPGVTVRPKFANNRTFTVPPWFSDKLNALKPSHWAPGGVARVSKPRSLQSKRATFVAPTPDNEDGASRARVPSLPAPRKASGTRRAAKARAASDSEDDSEAEDTSPRSPSVTSSTDESTSEHEADDDGDDGGDQDHESTRDGSSADHDNSGNSDDIENFLDGGAEDITPGSPPLTLRRSSRRRNRVVLSEGEDECPEVDMAETSQASAGTLKIRIRKRAREQSEPEEGQDDPAAGGSSTQTPANLPWRDMPSLEKQLGLQEQLSALAESSKARSAESPYDDEVMAAHGFAPDYDLDFDFERSIPPVIQDLTGSPTKEEVHRRVNTNFAYLEGETSSLWDAVTKLENSLKSGQQNWEHDFGELRKCTMQAIADNDLLSQKLTRAMEEQQQQKNDIAELRGIVNTLRWEQGLGGQWERDNWPDFLATYPTGGFPEAPHASGEAVTARRFDAAKTARPFAPDSHDQSQSSLAPSALAASSFIPRGLFEEHRPSPPSHPNSQEQGSLADAPGEPQLPPGPGSVEPRVSPHPEDDDLRSPEDPDPQHMHAKGTVVAHLSSVPHVDQSDPPGGAEDDHQYLSILNGSFQGHHDTSRRYDRAEEHPAVGQYQRDGQCQSAGQRAGARQ